MKMWAVGLKLALAPAGVPATVRLTVPENPLAGETVIVEAAAAPAFEVTAAGFAVIEKSGMHGTLGSRQRPHESGQVRQPKSENTTAKLANVFI